MIEVENTTYSGIGKSFGGFYEMCKPVVVDWKGRQALKGEEYYIFTEGEYEIYVHIEEVREYLNDWRLEVECYEQLIQLIETHYDNYPIIM